MMLNKSQTKLYYWRSYSISCSLYRYHKRIPTRWSFILMEMCLNLIYLFFNFIISYLIIQENNQQVKQIIKLIHIQPIIYYLVWTLRFFITILFINFFITGLLFLILFENYFE